MTIMTKKTITEQTSLVWSFLQPLTQVCRGASIPYFQINTPFSRYFLFFAENLYLLG